MAAILKKPPVAVNRWAGQAGKIRIANDDFVADLETLDRTLSTVAIKLLNVLRTAEQGS